MEPPLVKVIITLPKDGKFAPLHLMVCSNIDNRVARESRHLFLQWRFVGHEVIFWNKKNEHNKIVVIMSLLEEFV